MGNALRRARTLRRGSVHPHVHGERKRPGPRHDARAGSSPRTWGTQRSMVPRVRILRFIPTYMGNAQHSHSRAVLPAVHPHVHGERSNSVSKATRFVGSSPRTWGTPTVLWDNDTMHRFIPTYMGNAGYRWPALFLQPVHPHVHGERWINDPIRARELGSSPRTWGTRRDRSDTYCLSRFIPTYMGNATTGRIEHKLSTVHPHVHGERILCHG